MLFSRLASFALRSAILARRRAAFLAAAARAAFFLRSFSFRSACFALSSARLARALAAAAALALALTSRRTAALLAAFAFAAFSLRRISAARALRAASFPALSLLRSLAQAFFAFSMRFSLAFCVFSFFCLIACLTAFSLALIFFPAASLAFDCFSAFDLLSFSLARHFRTALFRLLSNAFALVARLLLIFKDFSAFLFDSALFLRLFSFLAAALRALRRAWNLAARSFFCAARALRVLSAARAFACLIFRSALVSR